MGIFVIDESRREGQFLFLTSFFRWPLVGERLELSRLGRFSCDSIRKAGQSNGASRASPSVFADGYLLSLPTRGGKFQFLARKKC